MDEEIKQLIEVLKKEQIGSHDEDQFGYSTQSAWDVYKSVIKRLEKIIKK